MYCVFSTFIRVHFAATRWSILVIHVLRSQKRLNNREILDNFIVNLKSVNSIVVIAFVFKIFFESSLHLRKENYKNGKCTIWLQQDLESP